MLVEIPERVLIYKRDQFDRWIRGDTSIIPSFVSVPNAVANQPHYHFNEAFTLRHYHQTKGWKGFWLYALGPQYPRSKSRKPNRSKVEQIIAAVDLQRFRSLQAADPLIKSGAGEPDLFLYNDDGAFMFVEIKRGNDALREPQRRCIALILAVLVVPWILCTYVRSDSRGDPNRIHLIWTRF